MRTYILFITLLCTLSLKAQIVDCTPSKPTGDDEVTVTFDLTKCSFQKASLVDFEGPIYSHMGVITSESPSGTEWLCGRIRQHPTNVILMLLNSRKSEITSGSLKSPRPSKSSLCKTLKWNHLTSLKQTNSC